MGPGPNSDQVATARQMPDPTSATNDRLDQDVGCPDCGYNLRGLGAGRVTCPECGLESDIAKLITRRWDRPWYKAPHYTLICLPASWAWLACIVLAPIAAVIAFESPGTNNWLVAPLAFAFGLLVWLGLMGLVWRRIDGSVSALFGLLAHVSVASYLAGLVLIVGGILTFIDRLFWDDRFEPLPLLLAVLALAGGVGCFYAGRRFERMVAGHCIRIYLLRRTTS